MLQTAYMREFADDFIDFYGFAIIWQRPRYTTGIPRDAPWKFLAITWSPLYDWPRADSPL